MKRTRMLVGLGSLMFILGAAPPAVRAQSCTDNSQCPPGYFCAKQLGDCDGAGDCSPRPQICVALWDPVCGCDGQTYSNSCYAAAMGVNVAYAGECIPDCLSNGDCPPDYYCAKQPGDCDGPGGCQASPAACPDIWQPVCGCDDQTYANACDAAVAGVNVKYEGPCAVCVNRPVADLNGDCHVDLGDLAIMAAQWLTCGLDRPEFCWQE